MLYRQLASRARSSLFHGKGNAKRRIEMGPSSTCRCLGDKLLILLLFQQTLHYWSTATGESRYARKCYRLCSTQANRVGPSGLRAVCMLCCQSAPAVCYIKDYIVQHGLSLQEPGLRSGASASPLLLS